ncbi:MAG: hypothetical protein ACRYG7_39610 [Janthinobacterium lividum]
MKKLLLLLLLAGAATRPALAQRHVQHISTWSAQVGRSEQGHYYELGYSTFLTDRTALRISGLYEKGTLGALGNYSSYGGRLFIAPQLLHLGEFAYVHLLLGGAGNYELGGEQPTSDGLSTERRQRFTYGPQAGAEADFFLGNRVSLVATATKSYLLNNPLLDRWPGYAGAGLRYHFR